ncbi:MAG: DUF2846 domain-containing protein [Thermoanaerobaculaceae bacterium]|nr:DUF2846 domain-containing protein [Thermoanaerobaculaceae bacterium]MDI9622911.1 DUF2846 domain-containing protein [Acidobacteriota bacterium]NLH10326.1 DUF2846 domain-containing protein [Holophagae bacterium]HPW56964.1 DUF2846 domain-containing protein [Thermoanaerobaculaceae bacterium]
MRVRSWWIVAFGVMVVIGLAGCSSTAPQQQVTAEAAPAAVTVAADLGDNAVLTFYRKKRIVGLALNTSVYVDGVEVAELDPGTYVKVKVAPGAHQVWADEEKDAFTLTAEAGKTYFVRMELRPGMWKGHGKAVLVDEATGAAEFAEYKCKLADEIKVPSMVVQ